MQLSMPPSGYLKTIPFKFLDHPMTPSSLCKVCCLLLQPDGRHPVLFDPPFLCGYINIFWDPLNQLISNSFWILYGLIVIFSYYNILLSYALFHWFFYPKRHKLGVFYLTTLLPILTKLSNFPYTRKLITSFSDQAQPSSGWTAGKPCVLPPQPNLDHYKEDSTYIETTKFLHNLCFDVNLLMEEDLLYHYELSSVDIELTLPLGIQLKPKLLLWLLTYFSVFFLRWQDVVCCHSQTYEETIVEPQADSYT